MTATIPKTSEDQLREIALRALKSESKRIASGLLLIQSRDVRADYTEVMRYIKDLVKQVDQSVISIDRIQRIIVALKVVKPEEHESGGQGLSKLRQEVKNYLEACGLVSNERTVPYRKTSSPVDSTPGHRELEASASESGAALFVSASPDELETAEGPQAHILTPNYLTGGHELVLWLDEKTIERQSLFPRFTGGFCDVYIGVHETCGEVALKRPRISGDAATRDQIRRFQKEALVWKRLKHPNILEFMGTIESHGCIWLVSPFAPNGPVTQYVQFHPEVERTPLVLGLASGISYLHNELIIHGDIKGNNVLIHENPGEGCRILLCDFGLSKLHGEGWITSVPMKGAGTVRWQAPELLDGNLNPKSFESDVYAFGITIFEIITGQKPFSAYTSPIVAMLAILGGERPPTQHESSSGESYTGLWRTAVQCWDYDPRQRPSMGEVPSLVLSLDSTAVV